MKLEDMLKGAGAVAAVGAVSVVAVGIGALVTRHPDTARRAVRMLMHGAQRVGLALAQTREELGDLWAEARDDLRNDLDLAEVRRAAESWAAEVTGKGTTHDSTTHDEADAVAPTKPRTKKAASRRTAPAKKAIAKQSAKGTAAKRSPRKAIT